MKAPTHTVSDSLLHADWESLAALLLSMEGGIKGNSPTAKKLRAELGVARVILFENMRTWNGNNSMDASFLIGTYKTINKIEKECRSNGMANSRLLILMNVIKAKFQKQKLKVNKRFHMISEFEKMKGVVENRRFKIRAEDME